MILSWKRPFYDIIMEVKTSKFSIFWKNLIKSATFCLIFKKIGKKFEHTYFEILNWKWPFYDVILGVNDLDLWYFVENLIKISYFSFDFPKKFENNNFEFLGWYCLYDIFWKKPVLIYKKKCLDNFNYWFFALFSKNLSSCTQNAYFYIFGDFEMKSVFLRYHIGGR